MDLNYTNLPLPISKLRRKTARDMLFAAVAIGLVLVIAMIAVWMIFEHNRGDGQIAAVVLGGVPLFAMVTLLVFRNAVARGSKAASIAVYVASGLQTLYSGLFTFMSLVASFHMAFEPIPFFGKLMFPLLLSVFLFNLVSCVRVIVLLVRCGHEYS